MGQAVLEEQTGAKAGLERRAAAGSGSPLRETFIHGSHLLGLAA